MKLTFGTCVYCGYYVWFWQDFYHPDPDNVEKVAHTTCAHNPKARK